MQLRFSIGLASSSGSPETSRTEKTKRSRRLAKSHSTKVRRTTRRVTCEVSVIRASLQYNQLDLWNVHLSGRITFSALALNLVVAGNVTIGCLCWETNSCCRAPHTSEETPLENCCLSDLLLPLCENVAFSMKETELMKTVQ